VERSAIFLRFLRGTVAVDEVTKSGRTPVFVITAKAGHAVALFKLSGAALSAIHSFRQVVDSGCRRSDGLWDFLRKRHH